MLSLSWRLNSLASSIALHGVASGSCLDGGRFFNTISKEKYYPAEEQIGQALDGSDLVIIPIDTPMEPDITNDDLFKINAGIVKPFCDAIAKCPCTCHWWSCWNYHSSLVFTSHTQSKPVR